VLAGFLSPFDLSAVNIALPTIASEFSMDAVTLDWMATACLLKSTDFLVPFRRMADIHGIAQNHFSYHRSPGSELHKRKLVFPGTAFRA